MTASCAERYAAQVAAFKKSRAVARAARLSLAVGDSGLVSIVEVSRNRALARVYQAPFKVLAVAGDLLTVAYQDCRGIEVRRMIRRTDAGRRIWNGGDSLRFHFDRLAMLAAEVEAAALARKSEAKAKASAYRARRAAQLAAAA